MPTVPTITPSSSSDGVGGGRAFSMPGQAPSAPGVSGFKTAGAPRPAKIAETSPDIRSGDYRAGEIEGKQLAGLGQAVGDAADNVGDIVLKMQQEANRTMTARAGIEMRTQAMRLQIGAGDPNNPTDPNNVTGYMQVRGINAVQPAGGKPLTADYMERFETARQKIREGLKNDAQRQAFDEDSQQLALNFETQAVKHTMDEYHAVQTETAKAGIEQASQSMALVAPDDVDGYNIARNDLITHVGDIARLNGDPAEAVPLMMQDALGKAGKLIIAKALAPEDGSGISRAQSYYAAHQDDFSAQERIEIENDLKTKANASIADSIGHDSVYGGSTAPGGGGGSTPTYTSAAAAPVSAAIKEAGGDAGAVRYGTHLGYVESGFHMDAQNGSSTSVFQMQPKTFQKLVPGGDIHSLKDQAKAMLVLRGQDQDRLHKAGLPVDDQNTYIMHQQGAGGGQALLKAAYGPARGAQAASLLVGMYPSPAVALDAIAGNIGMKFNTPDQKAKARAAAMQMSAGQFVDYWRTRWTEGAAGAARAPANRPEPAGSLEDATERARTRAVAMGMGSSGVQAAVAAASRYYSIHDSSTKEAERAGFNNAFEWLENNHGNYAGMPASIKNAVPASQWDSLQARGAQIAVGAVVKTDPATLLTLTNPAILKNTTDQEFLALRAKLAPGDFEQFARERGNLRNPKPTAENSPQDLNREAFNSSLKQGLGELGIVTSTDNKKYDAKKVGDLTRLAQDALYEAQRQAGRKFTDKETSDYVHRVFNTNIPFRKQLFGHEFGDETPGNMLEVEVKDIPRTEYNSVLTSLHQNKIANPTDDQILSAWRLSHTPEH